MKKKFISIICAVSMCSLTLLAGCGSSGEAENTEVTNPVKITCENGVMLGKTENKVTSFKGVPYAQQPLGDLRWKAPEAPKQSSEEVECYDFGNTALQYEWPTEPASSSPKGEDCLTLNIWEAEGANAANEAKPVMVFFHGGAYGWGGTTDPMYDGQNFVEANDDVILITCNYRLGLMAWADFSQIEGGEEYTDINLGIRDQIASLQWIRNNIKQFGGDPENVTIFGESAGAWSTTALTISPAAQGLFKRAIAESGVIPIGDREDAQEFADYIMEASGAKNMDELLDISAEKWVELDGTEWIADECCGAVADGEIIPYEEDVEQCMSTAISNGVQLLLGTNNDEWNYFQEDMEGDNEKDKFNAWVSGMNDMWKEAYDDADDEGKAALNELIDYELDQVPAEYAGNKRIKKALAKSAFITESWRYEHLNFADRYADLGGDVRMYLWKVPSTKEEMYKSAVHAVELAYVFNNLDEDIYAGTVDKATAKKAQEAWTNFAKTGDPSIEEVEWTAYDSTDRNTMLIQKDGWKMASDPSKIPRELLTIAYGDEPYQVW